MKIYFFITCFIGIWSHEVLAQKNIHAAKHRQQKRKAHL
jgi:hypothetical protein